MAFSLPLHSPSSPEKCPGCMSASEVVRYSEKKNPTWTELTCFQEFNFNNQGLTEVLKLDNLGLTVKGMSKLSLNLWQDEKNTQLTPVYLSTWFVCQQSWIRNR